VDEFWIYVQLGFKHIFTFEAYDHMIFVLALMAPFKLREWKPVLILVTAFTLGHSLTLALAVLDVVNFPAIWIEFFIPVTIFLAALRNVLSIEGNHNRNRHPNLIQYSMALLFGLIHGLGFSNNLKPLLGDGVSLLSGLFSFNLGVEFGQIGILLGMAVLLIFTTSILKLKHKYWNLGISSLVLLLSIHLMIQTNPWS
jgi:hypothetical protein